MADLSLARRQCGVQHEAQATAVHVDVAANPDRYGTVGWWRASALRGGVGWSCRPLQRALAGQRVPERSSSSCGRDAVGVADVSGVGLLDWPRRLVEVTD